MESCARLSIVSLAAGSIADEVMQLGNIRKTLHSLFIHCARFFVALAPKVSGSIADVIDQPIRALLHSKLIERYRGLETFMFEQLLGDHEVCFGKLWPQLYSLLPKTE